MGLVEPAPSINEPTHIIENGLQTLIEQQHKSEYQYLLDTSDLHWWVLLIINNRN